MDLCTVRLALSRLSRDRTVNHLDVKNASLHGRLDPNNNIYVKLPQGMPIKMDPVTGLKLITALYTLKEAAQIWLMF